MPSESELERALSDAGGADAPREWAARLRELLRAELERGAREMGEARSGRERPVALAVAATEAGGGATGGGASPGGASGEGASLALPLGACDGFLVLSSPAADPRLSAEYAREALDEAVASIDRLRATAHLLPGHALAIDDLRTPIGATHPLRVAEAATRLGASPLDEDSVERLEPELLR